MFQPETGASPLAALSPLMPALGGGYIKGDHFSVGHGAARLMATLRTKPDGEMAALVAEAEALVSQAAKTAGLRGFRTLRAALEGRDVLPWRR